MSSFRSILRLGVLLPTLALAFIVASPVESAGGGNVFYVDTTSDVSLSGCANVTPNDCSLRGAITKANLGSGNKLVFDLPNCPSTPSACVISPTSALPHLTQATTIIDSTTQNGYTDTPLVAVDGASAGTTAGIIINADNGVVRGLEVRNFNGLGIVDTLITQPAVQLNYNSIHDNSSGGNAAAISGEFDMDGNTITHNGIYGVSAAYQTMSTAVIQNNTITDNQGRGLDIAVSGDLTLTNNDISANHLGLATTGEGVYARSYTTSNVTFTNNHISNDEAAGAVVAAATKLDFTGNTITGNGGTGLDAFATATNDHYSEDELNLRESGQGLLRRRWEFAHHGPQHHHQ